MAEQLDWVWVGIVAIVAVIGIFVLDAPSSLPSTSTLSIPSNIGGQASAADCKQKPPVEAYLCLLNKYKCDDYYKADDSCRQILYDYCKTGTSLPIGACCEIDSQCNTGKCGNSYNSGACACPGGKCPKGGPCKGTSSKGYGPTGLCQPTDSVAPGLVRNAYNANAGGLHDLTPGTNVVASQDSYFYAVYNKDTSPGWYYSYDPYGVKNTDLAVPAIAAYVDNIRLTSLTNNGLDYYKQGAYIFKYTPDKQGNHVLTIAADPDSKFGETNENNNVVSIPFLVGSSTCTNGKKDGAETDVDCGGICNKCGTDRKCQQNTDCSSNQCTNGKCAFNNSCTPNCAGKSCGADDGCHGKCSSCACPAAQSCQPCTCLSGQTCQSGACVSSQGNPQTPPLGIGCYAQKGTCPYDNDGRASKTSCPAGKTMLGETPECHYCCIPSTIGGGGGSGGGSVNNCPGSCQWQHTCPSGGTWNTKYTCTGEKKYCCV